MRYVVCVQYYSLPEFPSECRIVHEHDLLPRDILLCNPYNFHKEGGVQFDPHLETMEYINCQPNVRNGIASRFGRYDEIVILFRTRFVGLKVQAVYVAGYYKVLPQRDMFCRDAPVIKASVAKFVAIPECVDITPIMTATRAHRSCPTTENQGWKQLLDQWLYKLENASDHTSRYLNEISRLKKIYGEQEFEQKGSGYRECRKCGYGSQSCPLVRRRETFGSPPRFPAHYN